MKPERIVSKADNAVIETARMALSGLRRAAVPTDPREDVREWRRSERPVYDLLHGLVETALVAGIGLRFLFHTAGYALYHEDKYGEPPDFSDDMFRFNAIVKPVLEPEHWRQEALMRGITFGFGLVFLGWAASTPAANPGGGAVSQTTIFWARLYLATHLCLDPVLGVADRIASADLSA